MLRFFQPDPSLAFQILQFLWVGLRERRDDSQYDSSVLVLDSGMNEFSVLKNNDPIEIILFNMRRISIGGSPLSPVPDPEALSPDVT
jgi:hypothetical protein